MSDEFDEFEEVEEEVDRLDASSPLVMTVREASELLQGLQGRVSQLSRLRVTALRELAAEGYKQDEIAEAVGLSPSRISQLMNTRIRGPR